MAYLVEFVVEDVLVVGKGDDELNNQLSSSGHDGTSGPPVGVLPADAVVLLVDADDVGCDLSLAVRSRHDTVKVFNHAQAIAA